jgi:excinuclease UvrABC nuclease subunit
VVVGKHFSNLDVFSIIKDGKLAYVNYLMVQNGSIIQTHTVPLEGKLDEPEDELLCFAIERLRSDFNSLSNEIIVPFGEYSKLSCDSKSNYFYLDTNTYPIERVYRLKIKVESDGITKVVDEKLTFKIV